jgi:hypothetical protein
MPFPAFTDELVSLRSARGAIDASSSCSSKLGQPILRKRPIQFSGCIVTDRQHQCRKPLSDRICLVRRFTSCFHCCLKCFASVTGLDQPIPFCVVHSPRSRFCTGSEGRHPMGLEEDEAGQSHPPIVMSRRSVWPNVIHRPGEGTSLREGLAS